MESLESKLDRLSPEQRKEVEDFVDFLLSRSGQAYPSGLPYAPLPVLNSVPPPLPLGRIAPVHDAEVQPVMAQDPAPIPDRTVPAIPEEDTSAPFQEIDGGVQERITHDYMDYGKFDEQPSPATEAVKNVKRRLVTKEGQDKPHHLLDWVD